MTPDRLEPSRAAGWQSRDDVEPISDLVNVATPGDRPRFVDRVGGFRMRSEGRALVLTGVFPRASVYRFDLTTFEGRFDMRRLYASHGAVAYPDLESPSTRRLAALLGPDAALTHTGPWDIYRGDWMVPTARVALDGKHIYTSWFDIPGLDDLREGRVYASFALEIPTPGEHHVRVSFDDFVRHTRWRPGGRTRVRPPETVVRNPLRPFDVAAVAVGEDERVRVLEAIPIRPELIGRHPRLPDVAARPEDDARLGPEDPVVAGLIERLDPDRGEIWGYSDDEESMASGNDMDGGRTGLGVCGVYDGLVSRLTPGAREAVDRAFRQRFEGVYRYFVFQRNYNATGYAQNHFSKAIWGLVAAGLVSDDPAAAKWRNWAVMVCRKRVELLGTDGGMEFWNEARDYGLKFWERSRRMIEHVTGRDIAEGPFFENEWRYALHNAPAFPENRVPVLMTHHGTSRDTNLPLPADVHAESTSTAYHFEDCDQVFMRSDWSADAFRVRLTAGSPFGRAGTPKALRYNWAHCAVNRGSISLWQGEQALLNEPGVDRTFRKSAGNNNCIVANDTDQWGGGYVYHPHLALDQVGRIAFFADGRLLAATRADLRGAYPPEARIVSLSRVLIHLRPDHFLVFDRLVTEGPGKGEWRFHAPFVSPLHPGSRFTIHAAEKRKGRPETLDEAFARLDGVSAEIEFLYPPVRADVRMSDPYFRGAAFRQPMRHLRVTQRGDGPMVLLTAVAPILRLESQGDGVFTGRAGSVSWRIRVGDGPHLTIVATDEATGRVEAVRHGPGALEIPDVRLPEDGDDMFVEIEGGEILPDGEDPMIARDATVVLAVVLTLAGAAPVSEAGPSEWGWEGAVHVDQILPLYMGGGLELAVLPTPQRAIRSDRLFEIAVPTIVIPDGPVAPAILRDLGAIFPDIDPVRAGEWRDDASPGFVVCVGGPDRNPISRRLLDSLKAAATGEQRALLGSEGYQLFVGRETSGRVVAVLAGARAAGDFWAVQSLRQLVAERGGRRFVTGAWILDWPGFPRRGTKGGRDYMPRYKDNFFWGGPTPELLENFGHTVTYISERGELDCSDENLARVEKAMRAAFDAGGREFAVKFDDTIVALAEGTARRFDDYGAAICHYFRELDRRVKAFDPSCRLFYLPQCYYTSADYPGFARAIREAGGLPADVGLVWTGPEVFSLAITLEDCRRYMEAFGCTRTRGLIYDNYLREREYSPLRGRGADLTQVLSGIFSERSTRLTRMTRCDYNWNPEAYDPTRALKLACRETVDRDPRAYRALYALATYYDLHRHLPPRLTRNEKLDRTREVNAMLGRLLKPLEQALDRKRPIVADFRAAIDVRVRKQSRLEDHGFREARAIRCASSPTLDGRLDEADWASAPEQTDFVIWDQAGWTKLGPAMGRPVSAARRTSVKILYDETTLYFGGVARSDRTIEESQCCALAVRARKKHAHGKVWWNHVDRQERDVYGVWHSPSLELFVAPGMDRMNYFHMVANVAGLTYDKFSGQPPDMWNPEWRVAGVLDEDGRGFTMEIAIPFASFRQKPAKKGDVWGLNVCRTWPGHQMWSFVWGPGGFHTPEDFGTLVFD